MSAVSLIFEIFSGSVIAVLAVVVVYVRAGETIADDGVVDIDVMIIGGSEGLL